MGTDIRIIAQKKIHSGFETLPFKPFLNRNYQTYAFLVGARNEQSIRPICMARGLPLDMLQQASLFKKCYYVSYLMAQELFDFDYDKIVQEDKSYIVELASLSEKFTFMPKIDLETYKSAKELQITYRQFLCQLNTSYFDDLEQMKTLGIDRIVFAFSD